MAYYLRRRTRKDGSEGDWQCIHHRPHPAKPGRKLTTSRTFPTKKPAQAWGVEQESRYNRDPNTRPDRAKQPFVKLVDQWQTITWPRLQPRSRARYEQICRAHLLPEFGQAPVGSITREWIRDFIAGLARDGQPPKHPNGKPNPRAGQPYAPGTLHKIHTTMSAVMQEAVERGMVSANPCRGIMRKRGGVVQPERRKMDCLTAAEALALADAIDPHYRMLIITAAFTGLRASELHGLRRRDVALLAGRLTVRQALKAWHNGVAEFGPTKTDKVRSVELAPELCELLAQALSPGGPADALVFTNADGNPIHQVAFLRNHFKPARERALPDHAGLRFHDLRHTFVSLLIAQNVHPKAIAEQAGHASVAMTMDRYGHLFPADNVKVKTALSAAFNSAGESNVVELRPSASTAPA